MRSRGRNSAMGYRRTVLNRTIASMITIGRMTPLQAKGMPNIRIPAHRRESAWSRMILFNVPQRSFQTIVLPEKYIRIRQSLQGESDDFGRKIQQGPFHEMRGMVPAVCYGRKFPSERKRACLWTVGGRFFRGMPSPGGCAPRSE